jgi:hypothetical protein
MRGGLKLAKKYKPMVEIMETRTLNVAGAGGGLYLYLPKEFCELYGIIGGDVIKVQLRGLFKRDYAAEQDEEKEGVKKHGSRRKRAKTDAF